VMLKRRSEKLDPRRKLEGLKRNVLPPHRLRRLEGPLSAALLILDVGEWSKVAIAVVVSVSGTAESFVITLSPFCYIYSASRKFPSIIPS